MRTSEDPITGGRKSMGSSWHIAVAQLLTVFIHDELEWDGRKCISGAISQVLYKVGRGSNYKDYRI